MKNKAVKGARKVTLINVAEAAGVSKSTVSRILDERLPRSESATARHVRAVARQLGYIRDNAASNLRRGRTMTVGVVVPRLTDTVMAILYEAISRACNATGHFAIVATTDDELDAERQAVEALLQRGVDGLILSTVRVGDRLPLELTQRNVPYVLALRTDQTSLSSVGDDKLGGYLATRHLVDLGHRRIALIAGPSYASSAQGRLDGYRMALEEAGLPCPPELVVPGTFSMDAGRQAVRDLLALSEPPTAIFAVNDNTAIGALSELAARGLRVPDDISLVGYNDIPVVGSLTTPLTSVHVPFDQIALVALDLLLRGAHSEGGRIRVTKPSLIPRKSTARVFL